MWVHDAEHELALPKLMLCSITSVPVKILFVVDVLWLFSLQTLSLFSMDVG